MLSGTSKAVVLLTAAAALLAPAAAAAGTRYAAPAGNGAGPCAQSDPCSVTDAVSGAGSGDFVFLKSGTYPLSTTLTVPAGVWVQGYQNSAAKATLSSSTADPVVKLDGVGATLEIATVLNNASGTGTALGIYNGGVADRVVVKSTGIFACDLNLGSLIRDSYCLNTYGGNGVALSNAAVQTSGTAEATNVTAVATGSTSIGIWASGNSVNQTLNAHNVIAESPNFDEGSVSNSGGTATVAMDHSNFSTYAGYGSGGTNALTVPGSGTNQTDAPLIALADAHQMEGSPTVDAGDNNAFSSGGFALFGNSRILDGTVDIGADEYDVTPTVSINKKPKKKTRSRKAHFGFSYPDDVIRVVCKLDHAGFGGCDSPATYKGLKRNKKHTFAVKVTDGSSQTATASYSWKVLKKK